MKYLALLFIIIGLECCQSDEPIVGVSFAGGSKIVIQDEDGNNMLDPNHVTPILLENLNLYFIVEGERKLYFDGNMSVPKGMNIYFDEFHEKWVLTVLQNLDDQDEDLITRSIIDFGDGTEGIIDGQWNKKTNPPGSGALYIEKIWYDGILVHEGNGEQMFTIIK